MINTEKFSISIPKELNKTLLNVATKEDRSRNYLIVRAIEQCYGGAALKGGKKGKSVSDTFEVKEVAGLPENIVAIAPKPKKSAAPKKETKKFKLSEALKEV